MMFAPSILGWYVHSFFWHQFKHYCILAYSVLWHAFCLSFRPRWKIPYRILYTLSYSMAETTYSTFVTELSSSSSSPPPRSSTEESVSCASPPVRIQPRSYQQKQTTYTSSTMSRVVVVSASGASTTRDKKLNEIILTCRIILNGCQFRLHCPLSAMYFN